MRAISKSNIFYSVSASRLKKIGDLVRRERPELTDEMVLAFCAADWTEGAAHQNWLNRARLQEIADWVLCGFHGQSVEEIMG